MILESIIQSEVSQKEKDKYILMHIYGIKKNGCDLRQVNSFLLTLVGTVNSKVFLKFGSSTRISETSTISCILK